MGEAAVNLLYRWPAAAKLGSRVPKEKFYEHGNVNATVREKFVVLGAGTPKLSAYFSTGWQPAGAERQALPIAITLSALYTALFDPLIPVSALPGEEMSEVAARLQFVRKLEREIVALERKLRTEPQLNRMIELRRTLKKKQAELEYQR